MATTTTAQKKKKPQSGTKPSSASKPSKNAPGTQPTGKSPKPVQVSLEEALNQRVEELSKMGFSSQLLKDDLKESLKDKKSKPLVVSIDEALKKILLAFNWKPGLEKYNFEFHPAELMQGCAILLSALGKKRPAFVKAIKDDLKKTLGSKLKKPTRAQQKEEAEKDALYDAWIEISMQTLMLYVGGEHVYRAFAEGAEDEKDARGEKPEKSEAVGELLEAVEGWVSALIVILARGGGKELSKWFDELKQEERHRYFAEKEIGGRWDKVQGLDDAKQKENEKKRQEEWEAFKKQPAGVAKAKYYAEIIHHWADLLKALIATWEAWRGMHPADIDQKEWVLEAPWATGAVFKLALKKKDENSFEGKLTAKGLAHPEERTFRQENVVETEKATCEVTRASAHAHALKFKWTPKGEECKKLPTAGDAFFAGTKEIEDEAKFESTLLISDALKVGLPPGEFRRKVRVGDYLKFGVSVLRVLAAIWGVLPRKQREKAQRILLEKFKPQLEKFFKLKPKFKAVDVSLDPKDWTLTFGLKSPRIHIKLGWDFVALVELLLVKLHVMEDEDQGVQLKPSALVPTSCEMGGKMGQFGELSLSLARLEKKSDKIAKTLDQLATLPMVGEEIARFRDFCKEHKIAICPGKPKVRPGDAKSGELPGLELPLICDVEELDLPWGVASFPATITLTFTLTAEQVASFFPPLRAILEAWEIGWAIGSFINELPATQEAMEYYGNWYVEWAAHEDWSKEYLALNEWVLGIQKSKWILHGDSVVSFIKSPYQAAKSYRKKHNIISAFNDVVPVYEHAIQYRDALAQRIAAGLKDPHQFGLDAKSIGHGMALAHVLGHADFPAEKVEQRLQAESGGKPLLDIEADFYRFYLYPAEYAARHSAFVNKYKAENDKLSPLFVRGQLSDAKAVTFERVYRFVTNEMHKKYIELICCTFPEKTGNTIEVMKQGPRWTWVISRAKANEEIKVEIVAKDGIFTRAVVERADHTKAFLAGCNIHWLTGDFSAVKNDLHKFRVNEQRPGGGQASGTWAYLRVIGEEGDKMESAFWFLEMDGQGEVVGAWRD
jgi:hypothetical protein